MNDLESLRERAGKLREELTRHALLYYVEDAPEISDFQYDALMRELQDIEKANPEHVKRYTFPGARHGTSYLQDTERYTKLVKDFYAAAFGE